MRGHLQRRGSDAWRLKVYVGRDANGTKRYVERTVSGTKKEPRASWPGSWWRPTKAATRHRARHSTS
jgi:hypothetical protein